MDIISLQEAKKAQRWIGPLKDLRTNAKDTIVNAINELQAITSKAGVVQVKTYELQAINGINYYWLDFVENAMIKGIKFSPQIIPNDTSEYYQLALLTDELAQSGRYVYDSGKIFSILWDIMDIPYISGNNQNRLYATFSLAGLPDIDGTLEIFYLEVLN